jgi:hypothetical protein
MLPGPGVIAVVDPTDAYSILNHQFDVSESVKGLELKVSPSTRIHGRVLDPAGKPVDGALVRVLYQVAPGDTVQADSEGRFSVSLDEGALKEGMEVRLIASDAAYTMGSSEAIKPAPKEARSIELLLQPTSKINGIIQSEEGKPVANARIMPLVDAGQYQLRSLHNVAVSDDSGKYILIGIIPGVDYAIRVQATGYAPLNVPKADVPKLLDGDGTLVLKRE